MQNMIEEPEEDKLEDSFKREPRNGVPQRNFEEPNVFENNISQSSNYEPVAIQQEGGDEDNLEDSGTGTFPQHQQDLEQVLLGGTFNAGKQVMNQQQQQEEDLEEEEDERELARIERVLRDQK